MKGQSSQSSNEVGNAISNYCKYKTEKTAMEKRRAESLKKLVKTNRSTRQTLENWMTSNNLTRIYLPPSQEDIDSSTEGSVTQGRYLSIRKTTSQRAINENAVRKALDDLFHQVNPEEQLSVKEPKAITNQVYQAVHNQCVYQGQTISVTKCRRPQKNAKEIDQKTISSLSKHVDVYDQTQKQIKDNRKHYAEARVYLDEKIQESEQPVRKHLLEQKASVGHPVQKVTLTSEDQEPEDVSLRFQQRKTHRCTKRLGLKILHQMIEAIIDRRTKQLAEREIYHVRWKDFLPVLMEDLVHDINEFHTQNQKEILHQKVYMRACSSKRNTKCNTGKNKTHNVEGSNLAQSSQNKQSSSKIHRSDKGKEPEYSESNQCVVRERSKKRKSSKKRTHERKVN